MQLMYAATHTRPDILFATSALAAARSQRPTNVDYQSLLKIVAYLKSSFKYRLVYVSSGPLRISAHVDASFCCHFDAKGHTGFIIRPCDNSGGILWRSNKQKSVAQSSTEAELIALHDAIRYVSWVSEIYLEIGQKLGFVVTPIEVHQDNKAASPHLKP